MPLPSREALIVRSFAKAAQLALGDRALAVTADSPSLAEGELDAAKRLAELIGIRHKVVSTNEIRDSRYTANNADRCYYCKSELYSQLDDLVEELAVDTGCQRSQRGRHR